MFLFICLLNICKLTDTANGHLNINCAYLHIGLEHNQHVVRTMSGVSVLYNILNSCDTTLLSKYISL